MACFFATLFSNDYFRIPDLELYQNFSILIIFTINVFSVNNQTITPSINMIYFKMYLFNKVVNPISLKTGKRQGMVAHEKQVAPYKNSCLSKPVRPQTDVTFVGLKQLSGQKCPSPIVLQNGRRSTKTGNRKCNATYNICTMYHSVTGKSLGPSALCSALSLPSKGRGRDSREGSP